MLRKSGGQCCESLAGARRVRICLSFQLSHWELVGQAIDAPFESCVSGFGRWLDVLRQAWRKGGGKGDLFRQLRTTGEFSMLAHGLACASERAPIQRWVLWSLGS